ncbi:MAG: DUF3445 domain-containing protein [Mesorhizobium sp.]
MDADAPNAPRHAPYDGSSKPFTIGLRPLDLAQWIEVDDALASYLAEKSRLFASLPSQVFVEEPASRAAQREVLDLLVDHLPRRHPDRYRLAKDAVEIVGVERVPLGESGPPLAVAARLVQEDLVLMRRDTAGWRLTAASLCFPSSWTLREKFGRPLGEIHAPVPGFGAGTRTATLIERIFDKLQPAQPVQRFNWSLQAGDALYHPLSGLEREDRAAARPARFGSEAALGAAFIRVERQTLRKLAFTGDILFTIRIYLDPLSVLARHPDRRQLATSFATQLSAMSAAELDYKGLAADRDRLVGRLRDLAAFA